MRLIIQPNFEKVSEWVANYVGTKIKEFNPTPKRRFVLGLPTGSSPLGMYKKLIELNRNSYVSFKNITTFNMDEYVGLSEEHPQSYHYFMYDNFFNHIDIDKNHINILNGNALDLEEECNAYESKIKAAGGINLFIGGIGPDGHIAFNEPGSSLGSLTRVKTLTMDTIIANSRFFDNDINKVPRLALTVGVKTVLDSDEILVIISGHAKARALAKVVEEGVNHMWTVSALQLHPKSIIVCDDASTVELKVGTVNYFKDIEAHNLDPKTQLI
ncbi:MAG: glucosamine-6-phosphate deaminase [Ignavibacteriaceae bacterium]|nr:glucosamine-6-phosphate deaminase [Ignavibacteriaceae bacterium]